MKIMMRVLSIFLMTLLLLTQTACDKSNPVDPPDQGIDPFSNGGNERNMIVVLSDIHLGPDLAYAECKDNLEALKEFLNRIKASSNVKELVIAGDFLDEWYVPATMDPYQGSDQANFVQRIAAANSGVIDAINSIIQDGHVVVTYVPGNHDLNIASANIDLILPGINQARDVRGLGAYSPAGCPKLVIEHGHRYHFFNAPDPISNQDAAPGSILPPGYFYTRIAALHKVQNNHLPNDTLKTIVPKDTISESQNLLFSYWEIWAGGIKYFSIDNKFEEKIIVTNVDGFTETYSVNDLVPFQVTEGGIIDVNLFKGIQDTWDERQRLNGVAVNIPGPEAITKSLVTTDIDNQAKTQFFLNPASDKRLVVFGHTHDPKITASVNGTGQKCIYANTGTWVDNSRGKKPMTFVVITPQNNDASSQTFVKLYSFENKTATMMAADSSRY